MKTSHYPVHGISVTVLLFSAVSWCAAWAADGEVLSVSTTQVVRESRYIQYREFIGRVEAGRVSRLGFELSGTIKSLHVDEGDSVSAGDLLAELDRQKLHAGRQAASAEIRRAEAALRLSEASLGRISRVADQQLIDSQTLDEAQASYEAAQALLLQARANRRLIDVDVEKSRLTAPYDGIVTRRSGDEGDLVTPGQSVYQLQESGRYEARIGIANHMADRFSPGDEVELVIGGEPLTAIIKAILPLRNPGLRTVDVLFTLPVGSAPRPGDLVKWRLAIMVPAEGFWVPLSALTEGVRGLWNLYVVSDADKLELRMVDIIHFTSDQAYVRGLLEEHERVVISGTQRIVPDQRVRSQEVRL